MYGNNDLFGVYQMIIFRKYKNHIKNMPPDWKKMAEDQTLYVKGELNNVESMKSLHFYNWINQYYPTYIDTFYILKEPPECDGVYEGMSGKLARAECCDQDNQCFGDGTDAWCCNNKFYCSSNLQFYSLDQKGILCKFD